MKADDYAARYAPPAPTYRFLKEKPPAHVAWLWPQRLPLAALSLLIGDPGVGKSLLTTDLAARLSVPQPWPDDPASERPGRAPPSQRGDGLNMNSPRPLRSLCHCGYRRAGEAPTLPKGERKK